MVKVPEPLLRNGTSFMRNTSNALTVAPTVAVTTGTAHFCLKSWYTESSPASVIGLS